MKTDCVGIACRDIVVDAGIDNASIDVVALLEEMAVDKVIDIDVGIFIDVICLTLALAFREAVVC